MNIGQQILTCFVLMSIIGCVSCTPKKKTSIKDLVWLEGQWMLDDGVSYEEWEWKDGEFNGLVFSRTADTITERLRIFDAKGTVMYEATVFNQNDGQPVLFAMDSKGLDSLHFVNMNHDFPNYILYKKMSDSTLYCRTHSISNDGFSFTMTKRKQ